jgi:AcrR family transcriptional regulator
MVTINLVQGRSRHNIRVTDAKERLISAAEHLFARHGVHRTQMNEINARAGQRNPSAVHYHFGSREGLLQAIIDRHSAGVDAERARRLDALGDEPGLGEVVAAILVPLTAELASASGRDYLRIVPQSLGTTAVAPPAITAAFTLAEKALSDLPQPLRSERLSGMFLAASTLLAKREADVDEGRTAGLDDETFIANLIAMATAMLSAPLPKLPS